MVALNNPRRSYRDSGTVEEEQWFDNQQRLHRDGGPALIRYSEAGVVEVEEWFESGVRHRSDGPAVIEYDPAGGVRKEVWFLNGHEVSPEQRLSVASQPALVDSITQLWGFDPASDTTVSADADSACGVTSGTKGRVGLLDGTIWDSQLGDLSTIDREHLIEYLHGEITERVQALADSVDPSDWQAVLDFRSSFYDYSFNNTLLIVIQQNAKHLPVGEPVAGYKKWEELGRQVNKGEKSIRILAPLLKKLPHDKETGKIVPDVKAVDADSVVWKRAVVGFRAVPVFSLSQTHGEPVPSGPEQFCPKLLQGAGKNEVWDRLTQFAQSRGYTVSKVENAGEIRGANGVTNSKDKTIMVRSDMSEAQQLKTLIHECAHMVLHSEITDYHAHRGVYEVEAESTAYIVSKIVGLDSSQYSFPYIAGWSKGQAQVVEEVFDNVSGASKEILDYLGSAQHDHPDGKLNLGKSLKHPPGVPLPDSDFAPVVQAREGVETINAARLPAPSRARVMGR